MIINVKKIYFKGRNFRGFAVFSQIRKSLFQQNFLKKSSSANILKKYAFVVMISNYCGIRKISKTQEIRNSGKQVF